MELLSTSRKTVDSATAWTQLVGLRRAELGRDYKLRLRGQGIDYRVFCDGFAGSEQVAEGFLPAGDPRTVRVPGLPAGPWGGGQLIVDARLSAVGSAVTVDAELTWTPQLQAAGPADIGGGGR